jgi:hypothetical protein
VTRVGELDLDEGPIGLEVRDLLTGVDFQTLSETAPGPDRFHYTVEYGPHVLQIAEPDLTPELHRVVQLVLGPAAGDLDLP